MITRLALLLAVLAQPAWASSPPQRVVSINLCTDALVLELLPRERIASVTWMATTSPVAANPDKALGVPVNYGRAEEVMVFDPDLVLSGTYSSRETVAILRKIGVPVLALDLPVTLAETRDQLADLAALLGVPGRGLALVAELDAAVDAARLAATGRPPRALLYRPNGFTVGRDTLMGELMHKAGFANVVTDLRTWGRWSLEKAIVADVEVLIMHPNEYPGTALSERWLGHPALGALGITPTLISGRDVTCAGPWLGRALHTLAEARRTAAETVE